MESAKIVSIDQLRIDSDGPGVCTLVHTYGCNMNCRWCSNPNTRYGDEYNFMTAEELYNRVCNHNLYYQSTGGGITFSGGEPLLWIGFIREFSTYCKENNWKLNVETACNLPRDIIDKTIDIIDTYLIDIKHMDSDIHKEYTDVDNKLILDNIRYISSVKGGTHIRIAVPLIPNVNDDNDNIIKTVKFMKECGIIKVNVIPYRKTGLEKAKKLNAHQQEFETNSRENIERVKEIFRKQIISYI